MKIAAARQPGTAAGLRPASWRSTVRRRGRLRTASAGSWRCRRGASPAISTSRRCWSGRDQEFGTVENDESLAMQGFSYAGW